MGWLRAVRPVALLCGMMLLPASSAAAVCDGAALTSGAQALDVAGARRTFSVRTAAAYDGRTTAPVVFAFHPFGMNGQYMQGRVPITRAWPEAIAVYPDGLATPSPSWQNTMSDQGNRDLAFFDAMLAWLDANACVDRARVFVMGYSNGAQFANLLACERRDAIAAVASAAGRLGCRPEAAAPVIISHGLQDRTIAYDAAVDASQVWAARNGCATPPRAGFTGCFAASACTDAAVTLCTYAGGHEYDVSFTRTAIAFFQGVPSP